MKPKRPSNEEHQQELFRQELTTLLDLNHPLCKVSEGIDWKGLEEKFTGMFLNETGCPAKPVRLMIGLNYLKYTYDLSDEQVVCTWLENPYWQYFTGNKYFEHKLPCDSSSLTRWRNRIEECGCEEMLSETIKSGLRLKLIKKNELNRVNVDTTVQTKAIRYPTDSRSYDRMREHLVRLSETEQIELRQNYNRVSKKVLRKQSGYASARQFKRAAKQGKKIKGMLGRVVRDIERKMVDGSEELLEKLSLANRLLKQKRKDKNKLYSIHEPDVECIAKGKIHNPFEFGCKVSLATTSKSNWIVGSLALHGSPYDGHTLEKVLDQVERLTDRLPEKVYCDLGYRGFTYDGPSEINIVKRSRKNVSLSELKWWKRRSAIEPIIGHMKSEHRLERNRLKGKFGDKLNALLSACEMNLRKIIKIFFGFVLNQLEKLNIIINFHFTELKFEKMRILAA